MNNKGMGINAKMCLYEVVILPTDGIVWGMRSAERRVNVLSMAVVTRMARVGNEKVHRRARIERELEGKVNQIMWRWFGHLERMDEHAPYR